MLAEALLRHIAAVRRRLIALRLLKFGLIGLLAGLAASCLLAAAGRLAPIPDVRLFAPLLAAAGLVAGLVRGAFGLPGLKEAARAMDRGGGLEERVSTALAMIAADTPIARIQREEALRHAESFAREAGRLLPAAPGRGRLIAAAGLAAALVLLIVLPNPMDEVVARKMADKRWIAEQAEAAAKSREELKSRELPPVEKEKLDSELKSLEEGLRDSNTSLEALEEMEQSMKRLKEQEMLLRNRQKASEQWTESWRTHPALKEIGDRAAAGDEAGVSAAVEQMRQQVAQMSAEEKEHLAEALDRLAETVAAPDEESRRKLQEALAASASEARSGGAGSGLSAETAQALQEALAQAMAAQQALGELAERAGATSAQLAQAGLAQAQRLAAQGTAVPPVWGASGMAAGIASAASAGGQSSAQPGQGSGSGAGAGQGSGSGAGTGQGSGSGAGAGQGSGSGAGAGQGGGSGAGTGQGSGSGAGTGQGSGSGAGSGGSGAGTGNGSRALVSTPRTPTGDGPVQSDPGPVQGGGGEIVQDGSAPVADGVSRPYEDVYVEYAAEAAGALQRSELPDSMRQLVRDYFTEIQPNR